MNPWGTIEKLSREDTRALQSKKLHHFINNHIYPFSTHYRNLFDKHKINPKEIKTLDDLKFIPFTSKADFLNPQSKEDTFRGFILQPDLSKIISHCPKTQLLKIAATIALRGKNFVKHKLGEEYRPIFLTFTTGTTKTPVPFTYTKHDINNLHTSGARMLRLFDIKESEHIVNVFPYAPHLAFWQVAFGGLSSNVMILSTGGGRVMSTEANIAAFLRMKPSVVMGVPSYVYHIFRWASEHKCDMSFVRKIVLGAARVSPAFKRRISKLLASMGAQDVSVFGTYGFTESRCAWAECPTKINVSSGYHLYPDKEIFEVIDSKTGQVQKEGEDGELVYTSLDARGSTVIRYRTGDFVKGGITHEPCPYCGRNVARISSNITRVSNIKSLNLSKVKGTLVNLNNLTALLNEFDQLHEWQVEIRKKDNDPFEVDELIVYACLKKGHDKSDFKNK